MKARANSLVNITVYIASHPAFEFQIVHISLLMELCHLLYMPHCFNISVLISYNNFISGPEDYKGEYQGSNEIVSIHK